MMQTKLSLNDRSDQHPYAQSESSFQYLYCFGLGVMAMGNMRAITELQDYFETILDEIHLPMKQREQIIVDINNYLEFRLTEVVGRVQRKEERYCFVLDLYRLYNLSLWSQDYCEHILENYIQIFHFSEMEREFFQQFNEAARKNDCEMAVRAYEKFCGQGYEISYTALRHFFPEFYLETSYGKLTVEAGETLLLDRPVKIEGDITVERGGSLLLYGADVTMNGSIYMNGGRFRMRGATVRIGGCGTDHWLMLHRTAVVKIENTEIDLGLHCGLLSQDAGRLIMTDSRILHAAKAYMLSFSGYSAKINRCYFRHGRAGLLSIGQAARMHVDDCVFIEGSAEYGGAVYSDSIGNVRINRCHFERCQAKYLGAAVYFKYHKYGQLVRDCICQACTPEEKPIFHVYSDDVEIQIR
ncbi:MAG: right-handed parallel beta-helix repeat-containing protein [Lachnospiraceae bacterium]|nr:right-handed parallel beta-helix repeat-containing protein [Lachnospiraceae bacterium]